MIALNNVTKAVKGNRKKISINMEVNEEFEQTSNIPIIERPKLESDSDINLNSESEKNSTNEYQNVNDDKQQKDSSNAFDYKFNEIINLPESCSELIDLNSYYSFGVDEKNSNIESVLYIIDKNFKLLKQVDKENTIATLINLLKENLEKYYKQNNYSKKGIKKVDLFNQLQNSEFNESLLTYLSDYFNINILVVDIIRQTYKFKNTFNEKLKNVILINYEKIMLPLVHIYGEFVSNEMIDTLKTNFKLVDSKHFLEDSQETELAQESEKEPDSDVKSTNNINGDNQKATQEIYKTNSLKNIRNYSLKELQDLSTQYKLNLNITLESGKTKKKTKLQLYNELTDAMN